MGVVKTASESILEETVMPSEEANYSQQGYAGKGADSFLVVLRVKKKESGREREREIAVAERNPTERKASASRSIRCRDQGRLFVRSHLRSVSDRRRNSYCSRRRSFKGDVANRPPDC